jgi:dihydrodipicolinate synthase/N-acetylneuraminate lyase
MHYKRAAAKQWTRNTLSGYIVTTTTPFKNDLEIDYAGLRHNVDHLIGLPGARGLYLGSVYQEFWTLTMDERKRVTDTMIEANAGRVPIIAGVSHTSYKDSIELARHAQTAGADLVMCWPPYYGPRSADGVFEYYQNLANAVDIGICVYSSTLSELGYYITPAEMVRLAGIDTICLVKEAALSLDKYSAMLAAAGHLLPISCPLEEYHLYGLSAFGPKIMPKFLFGSSRPLYMQSKAKPYCAEFMGAIEVGDYESARVPLQNIVRIANQLHSKFLAKGQHNVALTKAITEMFGMIGGAVRPPLYRAASDEIQMARALLQSEGLLP